MKKQIRSARVFTIGFVGDAEVTEGAGDCLTLGVGTFGETVAVVEQHSSPTLETLRGEMESSELGIVNVVTLTGEHVTDRNEVEHVSRMAGRQVDIVLKGIFNVRYIDGDDAKVTVKVSRRGRQTVEREPRFELVPNRQFHCLSCRNAGDPAIKTVATADMEEVTVSGRRMTIAPCPSCDSVMTRAGGIRVRHENHKGLSDRRMFFEPPQEAYCFSCRRNVHFIWIKAVRKSDEQPRPSYRGNCFRCLGMVGTPWHRTRLVPIKAATLEKLLQNARDGEDAIYAERQREATRRHNRRRREEERRRREDERNEMRRMQEGIAALKLRYKVA